jgi:hypothetical protein
VKRLALAIVILSLSCFSLAVDLPRPVANSNTHANEAELRQEKLTALSAVPPSPATTTACSFTFTSGINNNSLEYCVTANGNISEFQTPIGHPLVSIEDRSEGYAICDLTNIDRVPYSDFAGFGDTGNWHSPVVLSRSATSLKIARTTSDGIWTLTQTITQMAGTASAKIMMSLKNNTGVERQAFLVRWADVDADGFVSNNFDGTNSSAFGWNSTFFISPAPVGLLLQNLGTMLQGVGSEAFGQNTFFPPDPCNPEFAPAPLVNIDGSVVLLYGLVIPKNGSKSVTMTYKGL